MRFYDALQLNPGDLKNQIRKAETKKEKRWFRTAMLVRAILLVIFSIIFIAPVAPVFGAENNCVAVSLLCILLSVRFVDFGYRMKDALFYMAVCFMLMVFAPAAAAAAGPVPGMIIHFAAIFIMIAITSDVPEMGNGGLYAFAYVFIVGNPVTGELLWKRFLLMTAGYLLCAVVYYYKFKGKNAEISFHSLISNFHLSIRKCQWQLQLALGVSLMLALGSMLKVERVMWAGFACASLLGCYTTSPNGVKERFWERMVGAVLGSVLFYIIYRICPPSLYGLFGPIGGIFLGFCTEYRYKTVLNCFGALMLATGLYGLSGSVFLRIGNNLLGAAFGFAFSAVYQKVMERHFSCSDAA